MLTQTSHDLALQANLVFQANLYKSANPTRRWLHQARRDWVMEMFQKVVPVGGTASMLEVGVGCGEFTALISHVGWVFALDINPDFVAKANYLPRVCATVGDITVPSIFRQYEYETQADIALCSEVLEHVHDSLTALKNIHSTLKPSGILILTTPNAWSSMEMFARLLNFRWATKLASKLYGEPVAPLGHINLMTARKLTAQIKEAGFEILHQEDIGLYLPLVAEAGGQYGMRLCRFLAHLLSGTWFRWLCWTQCYICRPVRVETHDLTLQEGM